MVNHLDHLESRDFTRAEKEEVTLDRGLAVEEKRRWLTLSEVHSVISKNVSEIKLKSTLWCIFQI